MRMIRTILNALAIVTLLAGSARGAMGQSQAPLVGEAWSFFSGSLWFDGEPFSGPAEPYEDNGLFVILGNGFSGQTMTASDPRMSGLRTERSNSFADALDENTVNFDAVLATIENDDGVWRCSLFGVAISDVGASQSGWCDGTGAYDCLRAYVVFDTGGYIPGSPVDVYGFITTGDGPPMPEAPAR